MPLLKQAFTDYMAGNPNRAAGTEKLYLEQFARYLGDWQLRSLDSITRRDVEDRFSRLTEDHGWACANRGISLLRSIYRRPCVDFATLPDGARADTDRVTVMVSRGSEDDRTASPLEIARGDCLRIGATHWEKQLFNGTVVTVDDFKVQRGEAGTEPSVLISARTEDGREVRFRHDEIRDWYGNIRLDHGYALTITSAQGLTVDWTFLLADARPSRETIYPAATRHREGLDIYVNRAPLALDIADRRADNDREAAVTDTEIRAYLAERWSRSQPKEAALDYMADGIWEDRREDVREDRSRSPGEAQGEAGDIRAAANDNTLARIARDVRRTAFGWRHAQAVASFVDGRQEVLASYDDLRERTRIEGDAVALSGVYRETLTRHAVLQKQAAAFRARPDDFASLLAERGGIGRKDLDAFEELHARARRHRRAATMRHVHRIKREAEQEVQQPEPELRQGDLALEGGRAEAPRRADTAARDTAGMESSDRDAAPAQYFDTIPPVEAEDYPWAHAAPAQEDVPAPRPDRDRPRPGWYAPCEALQRDWNELIERVHFANREGGVAAHPDYSTRGSCRTACAEFPCSLAGRFSDTARGQDAMIPVTAGTIFDPGDCREPGYYQTAWAWLHKLRPGHGRR